MYPSERGYQVHLDGFVVVVLRGWEVARKDSRHPFLFLMQIRINVAADLSRVLNVNRFAEKNRPAFLKEAGKRYVRYLRQAFIARSSGGGWAPLKQVTIDSKKRRGLASNPDAILRETDQLLDAITWKATDYGIEVGFVIDAEHNERGGTIFGIAQAHTDGAPERHLPSRPIIISPSPSVQRAMIEDIRANYYKAQRKNRK